MKAIVFVRPLLFEEEYRLKRCLRCKDLFAVRRAQVIVGSARGESASTLSRQTGYTAVRVRSIIHLFNEQGERSMRRQSTRPKTTAALLQAQACEKLRQLLHHSPRQWGKNRSLWSLELLAEVLHEEGLTPHQVSYETVRRALKRMGVSWKRAKHWITSPDAGYQRKKTGANA